MQVHNFIAKKIIQGKNNRSIYGQPVIRLAIASMSLGVAVMLVTVMIVTGFKKQITEKVSGFASHLQITPFASGNNVDESSMSSHPSFLNSVKAIPGITHLQPYARKAGILKTKDEFEGVVLKGIDKDYDLTFIKKSLLSGKLPNFNSNEISQEVLISKNLSEKLNLKTGEGFLVYFLEDTKKVRKFIVSGIYSTGLSDEFDNIYIFCDLKIIQKLNGWNQDQIAGFEVFTSDFSNVDNISSQVYNITSFNFDTKSIKEIYPQIFNWLDLQNINVIIIITLMMLVAGINMISTLLIIILDNTLSIGLLKALGASSGFVRRIYLQVSLYIVVRGLLIGNIIGIGLCAFQLKTNFITLPQESYYVSSVPVNFTIPGILLINGITFIVCILMLIIPSGIISRLSPAKVLQFS